MPAGGESAILLVKVDKCPVVADVDRGDWCGCGCSCGGEKDCGDDGLGSHAMSCGGAPRAPGVWFSLMRK